MKENNEGYIKNGRKINVINYPHFFLHIYWCKENINSWCKA